MLKYQGGGFIIGIPARDLNDDEAKKYGEARLIKSGLYKRVHVEKPKEEKIAYKAKESKKWQE